MPAAKPRVTRPCETCGVLVERVPSQILSRVFCSRQCAGRGFRSGVLLTCDQCRGVYYQTKLEAVRRNKKRNFCWRECAFKFRATHRKATTYLKCGQGHRHMHRMVAAHILGRELAPKEVVHHIDGNRANNKPQNLAVFPSQSHHNRCHQNHMSVEELRRYALVPEAIK